MMKLSNQVDFFHLVIKFSLSLEGFLAISKFLTQQMFLFFKGLLRQGSALVFIDDILFISKYKPHMLQLIKQFQGFATKKNLKLPPEKFFFMLLFVKYFGHEIGFNTTKSFRSKIFAVHKIHSRPQRQNWQGSLAQWVSISNNLILNFILKWKLCDLLHDNAKNHWNDELLTIFQQIKSSLTKDVTLTLGSGNRSFFNTVDFLYMV